MNDEVKNEGMMSSTTDLNLASFILASGYEEYTFRKVVDVRGKQRLTFDFKCTILYCRYFTGNMYWSFL